MDDLQKYIQKRKLQDKDFAENFDKGYEDFKNKELKNFDISEYLDSKEIKDEYLAQVLKDGDKDELLQALENIEKAKT
ncbi:MAG: DNA-binding protein [Candidatus Paceibacteria bacterium]